MCPPFFQSRADTQVRPYRQFSWCKMMTPNTYIQGKILGTEFNSVPASLSEFL